jgi:hypothetical protein
LGCAALAGYCRSVRLVRRGGSGSWRMNGRLWDGSRPAISRARRNHRSSSLVAARAPSPLDDRPADGGNTHRRERHSGPGRKDRRRIRGSCPLGRSARR